MEQSQFEAWLERLGFKREWLHRKVDHSNGASIQVLLEAGALTVNIELPTGYTTDTLVR